MPISHTLRKMINQINLVIFTSTAFRFAIFFSSRLKNKRLISVRWNEIFYFAHFVSTTFLFFSSVKFFFFCKLIFVQSVEQMMKNKTKQNLSNRITVRVYQSQLKLPFDKFRVQIPAFLKNKNRLKSKRFVRLTKQNQSS